MTTATTTNDDAERARRTEIIRDTKAALAHGETFEGRAKRREEKADDWSRWFRHRMDAGDIADPVQLLPDAFARLELLAEDRVVAAMKGLKAEFRKAVS
jgi:hypothetical protein